MPHTQTYNSDEIRGWSDLLKRSATVQYSYVCVCLLVNLQVQKGQKFSAIK